MSKAIVKQDQPEQIESQRLENRVVMPAVSAEEAYEAWKAYQDLKNKIIDPKTDIQVIRNQEFKKKSYWRKVATFFNLSIETRDEWKEMLGRTLVWHFTVRATAPNGRFVEGVGSCDVYEKATLRDGIYQIYDARKSKWVDAEPNSPHNTRSTAYTRAYNRAVSDLVGGGEVSAEEMAIAQRAKEEQVESAPAMGQNERRIGHDQSVWPAHHVREVAQFRCEKCDETMPLQAMLRSKERYDDHTLCFKHQLAYKKQMLQQKQASQEAEATSTEAETVAAA